MYLDNLYLNVKIISVKIISKGQTWKTEMCIDHLELNEYEDRTKVK